ncbi:unnamed protein product [Merluccius merluccius]
MVTFRCDLGVTVRLALPAVGYEVSGRRLFNMKLVDLEDSAGRFRVAEACVGLLGCACVCYAVWTPDWFAGGGLWTGESGGEDVLLMAQEVKVFGVLSSLMAVSSAALCLVFALCWTSKTVHSYSNTRSLLMAGQMLYPTTLLLLTLAPTGFFFLLSWSLFTSQHIEEIQVNLPGLGSSYWLGVLGWALLLVVHPVVFLVEQCVVPDPLPDLMKSVLFRQSAPPPSSLRPHLQQRLRTRKYLQDGDPLRAEESRAVGDTDRFGPDLLINDRTRVARRLQTFYIASSEDVTGCGCEEEDVTGESIISSQRVSGRRDATCGFACVSRLFPETRDTLASFRAEQLGVQSAADASGAGQSGGRGEPLTCANVT